jgi:hypothetical protein
MPGFETLPQAIPQASAYAPVFPEEVRFEQDPWDDATALGIMLADIDAGIAFEQAKNFATRMETADDLLRGYVRVRPWPNTDKARSALSVPLSMEAIEKIMPVIYLSIWGSGKDPFLVEPKGKTKPAAAKAWQSLLRWAVKESNFKEGSRLTLKSILTFGFGCGFDGWQTEEIEKRHYKKNADGTVSRDKKAPKTRVQKPTYDCANLRNTMFDPSCYNQDPNSGQWIARRMVINAYVLDEMREDPTYRNIPTREELAFILANKAEPPHDSLQALKPNQTREFQAQDDKLPSTKDPLGAPLELIEYRTRDRIVTALQRMIVVRNEENKSGELGVHGCAFIDVLNSLFGFGVPHLVNGEQRLQQGVLNTWVDSLALLLNPSFQMTKGLGSTGQNISIAPGRVVTVESELKPLVVPDVSSTAQEAIEASQGRAYRRVGAEGGSIMPTQALRTGTGVQAFQGDMTQRMQYFMEQFLNLVFVPVLKTFLVHCAENLQPEDIHQILSDEDGQSYQGDILDIYNADLKVDIVSGVKLTTKQAAAQIVPLLLQTLMNQAVQSALQVQGKKFDFAGFTEEWFELMGWDSEQFFVPMTPADLQRAQEQNQAMQRAQGDLIKIGAQHQANLDEIDQKAAGQGGLAVLKSVVKTHEAAGMKLLEGEANGLEQTGPASTQ